MTPDTPSKRTAAPSNRGPIALRQSPSREAARSVTDPELASWSLSATARLARYGAPGGRDGRTASRYALPLKPRQFSQLRLTVCNEKAP